MNFIKMKGAVSILLWFLFIVQFYPWHVMADNQQLQTIVFLGTSLTAGYGVESDEAYPSLIQRRINALGLPYRIINAGQSGDTTFGGLQRLEWLMRVEINILVIEMGINDGLRGLPVGLIRKNLQTIINSAKNRYPKVQIVLAGMLAPPNMGQPYTTHFATIYPALAKTNDVGLIPFLLDGVGGNPELNLPDGIHPSVEGYKIVAENVWKVIRPLLKSIK